MGNPGLGAGVLFVGEHERDARASGGDVFVLLLGYGFGCFYCSISIQNDFFNHQFLNSRYKAFH